MQKQNMHSFQVVPAGFVSHPSLFLSFHFFSALMSFFLSVPQLMKCSPSVLPPFSPCFFALIDSSESILGWAIFCLSLLMSVGQSLDSSSLFLMTSCHSIHLPQKWRDNPCTVVLSVRKYYGGIQRSPGIKFVCWTIGKGVNVGHPWNWTCLTRAKEFSHKS